MSFDKEFRTKGSMLDRRNSSRSFLSNIWWKIARFLKTMVSSFWRT